MAVTIHGAIDRDIAGDIAGGMAGGMAGGIAKKMVVVLKLAVHAVERKEMMEAIGLVSNVKNFNAYIEPLVP